MTADRRVFSPEVKLATVKRLLAGEDIRKLARSNSKPGPCLLL
jgi:transposase-like protein